MCDILLIFLFCSCIIFQPEKKKCWPMGIILSQQGPNKIHNGCIRPDFLPSNEKRVLSSSKFSKYSILLLPKLISYLGFFILFKFLLLTHGELLSSTNVLFSVDVFEDLGPQIKWNVGQKPNESRIFLLYMYINRGWLYEF